MKTHLASQTARRCRQTAALALLLVLAACASDAEPPPETSAEAPSEAQQIIDQAIAAHGGDVLDRAVVEFDFRGRHFTVRREDGRFRYTRTYTDSTGAEVREVLTNDSLYQTVDGVRQDLSPQERRSVETAVNSVVYFALLPYRLNDPAVKKQYLGITTIEGEPYHEVEVTFRQEGGGRDWQDRFIYWIHQDRHTMDYLAYYYHTDETGSRFRKAVNPRTEGGVRFADYLNYRAAPDTLGPAGIDEYDEIMKTGELDKVSEIRTENVEVRPLGEG